MPLCRENRNVNICLPFFKDSKGSNPLGDAKFFPVMRGG
jgi:hypothetical protein